MVDLICIPLILNEVSILCLLSMCIPSLETCPFIALSSSFFFIGLFIFLIDFRNSLYIRTVNLQYYVSDIFLPAYCYSFCERMFTFRLCLFIREEFKIVSQSICQSSLLWLPDFLSCFEMPSTFQGYENILLCFLIQ